jgi:hypothetical protein
MQLQVAADMKAAVVGIKVAAVVDMKVTGGTNPYLLR